MVCLSCMLVFYCDFNRLSPAKWCQVSSIQGGNISMFFLRLIIFVIIICLGPFLNYVGVETDADTDAEFYIERLSDHHNPIILIS